MKPGHGILSLSFSLATRVAPVAAAFGATAACGSGVVTATPDQSVSHGEDAAAFVARVNTELRGHWIAASRAAWTNATDITDLHAKAEAEATERVLAYLSAAIKEAERFEGTVMDDATARQLKLLRLATANPAPDDAGKRAELAQIVAELQSMYGKGKYCRLEDGRERCSDLGELSDVISSSRDQDKLLDAWTGWRKIAPPMRAKYQRFVELANEGAREVGYADLGQMWRDGYDMSPEAFEADVERLWHQVKPMYDQLHCHVRAVLSARYGPDVVPPSGLIPAHLLGNMWAQEWGNVYPLVEPHAGLPSIDVTAALQRKGMTSVQMVEQAESFFVSLGLDPLPPTFWERSMFDKPRDKDVVCHASAWDVEYSDDLRIKMCIKINMEDLVTIHHELGHNYYFHAYKDLPPLFQNGAHDGFHEGIGDTLALSVTPQYLHDIGLLEMVSNEPKAVINKQMRDALDKVAFLPFGLLVDRWRWDVFSGKIKPENYNMAWWELRRTYQGVREPVARTEQDFDPGAKFHIPGNTPYSRYFLARVLQFQFHEALCRASGHEGPLHTCSIFGSKEAGAKLQAMLAMGASRPWPEALEAVAGTREMDAGALIRYFEPLTGWLAEQNKGRTCGWQP
ncbi:MAG: M2 family metallopeptidase [Nannocystaceae bacterium]